MSNFQAALPQVIKWSVSDNEFDDKDKNPKTLRLFIPKESIAAFAQHLTAMAADSAKLKNGKVWNYDNNQEVEVRGVYLNAKGKSGEYGDFGNINPALLAFNPPAAEGCPMPPAPQGCPMPATLQGGNDYDIPF